METATLDFKGLNETLLIDARDRLSDWLPGGKVVGQEYVCADISGGEGRSFSVNLYSGQWADFANATMKGGDLISLYATIRDIGQGDAFKELADGTGFSQPMPGPKPKKKEEEADPLQLGVPPENAPSPDIPGSPTSAHVYRDSGGTPIFHVIRYDIDGKKVFSPRTWSHAEGKWVKKQFPRPRPIFGLDRLENMKANPVMVVEGEKAAEAADSMCGHMYAVISWPGGSEGWRYVDWKPLKGRRVVLWPDADEPGVKCMDALAQELPTDSIKVIDTTGQPDGWDAANAKEEGWNWERLLAWAKPRARVARAPSDPTPEEDSKPRTYESSYGIWLELDIELSRQGAPIKNLNNATKAVTNWHALGDNIWYDVFHDKVFTTWDGEPREWRDDDTLAVTRYMQEELRLPFGDELVFKAIRLHARDKIRNEPLDYLKSLEWDGTERVGMCFHDAFGSDDDVYNMAASQNFWVGLAARIARPGCKLDTMVVFEGKQGALKSSALNVIGGDWYAEATESVNSKDFYLTLRGKIILEIGEMDAFSKADTTRIKQIISNPCDRYRRPYGRLAEDFPRRCVFAGTTNERHYLKDTTGARRFWPVECKKIDLAYLKRNRDQLFAEAYEMLKNGEAWWVMPEDETKKQQEARRQTDSWEDVVRMWINKQLPEADITTHRILHECLQIEAAKQEHRHTSRIGRVMRSLGYKPKVKWNTVLKKSERVYVPEKISETEEISE